jgi:hypothetical protein
VDQRTRARGTGPESLGHDSVKELKDPGEAKLGDGYVVTHDKRAGKLTLTTVTGGTAAGRVIGDLPDTGVSQRDVRWTVDEAGANAFGTDPGNTFLPNGSYDWTLAVTPADGVGGRWN